jgi:hypothetical protein
MDENWVLLKTTSDDFTAEIIKGMLEENQIEIVVMNKRDSEFLLGEVELYVHRNDVEKANVLLAEHQESE